MIKKYFAKAAAAVMAVAVMAGMVPAAVSAHGLSTPAEYTSGRGNVQSDSPFGTIDLLTKHEVYRIDSQDDFDEYQIIYYGATSGKLMALHDVIKFKKGSGYTVENLEALDVDEILPGFSSLEFADHVVVDRGNFVDFIIRFNDLEDMDNMRQMDDKGFVELENRDVDYVTAESYMKVIEESGAEKVDPGDYANLNLEFNLD